MAWVPCGSRVMAEARPSAPTRSVPPGRGFSPAFLGVVDEVSSPPPQAVRSAAAPNPPEAHSSWRLFQFTYDLVPVT